MSTIDPIEEQKQIQDYYDAYLDLFLHPGWQRFVEDLRASLEQDQKNAVARCTTAETWHEERGAQTKTLRILSFETMIRNKYDEFIDSINDADPEEED